MAQSLGADPLQREPTRFGAAREKAFAAERQVAIVRASVIALNIFVYLFLMDQTAGIQWLAYTIVFVAATYASTVLVFQPYRRFPVLASAYVTAATDGLLIVLWILATGGYSSPFYLLWYVSLSAVAFRFNSRATALVAGLYAAAYVGLLMATGTFLPHVTDVVVRVGYIFLIGLLGGYQSQETFEQTQQSLLMRELMVETKAAEANARKSAQEARASLALLTATLDSTADGILVVDAQGRITSYNSKFVAMWNIPREIIDSRDDQRAIQFVLDQVKDPDTFGAKIRELYAHPDAISQDEIEFKDGRVCERYSQPYHIGGSPAGRVWSFRDVTERRKAERDQLANLERDKEVERLRELDRFKTQFVNSVAHELWTPLTPIKLRLHMLQNGDDPLTERQARGVDIIARNMDRLIHLVEELLDGARLQAGRFRVQREPMNLHKVAAEMVELFQLPADAAGVHLQAQLDPDLPVDGDANRLVQVMYNLLSNALKFTPRGGRIEVRTRKDHHVVRVSVKDTGAGLTAEQRERLFQAFSQVHDTMQQTRAGTGLGLYISRAIVEAHNGLLTAHSDGPGRGSTFEFTIPLHAARPMPTPAIPAHA